MNGFNPSNATQTRRDYKRPNWELNRIIAALGAMAASAGIARAAVADCPTPPGAIQAVLPSGLPHVLQGVLGDVALPGEPLTRPTYMYGGINIAGTSSYGISAPGGLWRWNKVVSHSARPSLSMNSEKMPRKLP